MSSTADRDWTPGPLRPLLTWDAVHVWRADLAAVSDELLALLSPAERARAKRFRHEQDERLWTRSRAVLRALLGRYLRADAHTLRFATGAHGKPALLGDAPEEAVPPATMRTRPASLLFNLSHSGELALYAFTPTAAVGVDVEFARRPIDTLAIAARTFGPREARRLEGLERPTREREFLRSWVRHEAKLKCLGVGIGGACTTVGGPRPWIADLEVGSGGAAAVAIAIQPRELHCWDWPVQTEGLCG
jgi:4'-phosphopantetheinyl transferase